MSKLIPKDPIKSSRLRRSRGYSFEYDVVTKLKNLKGWNARRLGGSSTGLPDVVATYNRWGILVVMECKSIDGHLVYIPDDQVERLLTTAELFGFYDNKWIVFAFKFKKDVKDKDPLRKTLQYRFVYMRATLYPSITGVYYDLRPDHCVFHIRDNKGDLIRVTKKGVKDLATLLTRVVVPGVE